VNHILDLACWLFFTALLAIAVTCLPVLLVLDWLFGGESFQEVKRANQGHSQQQAGRHFGRRSLDGI
jgi:hypothetical protein